MLDQRRRRWANIKPALVQCLELAVLSWVIRNPLNFPAMKLIHWPHVKRPILAAGRTLQDVHYSWASTLWNPAASINPSHLVTLTLTARRPTLDVRVWRLQSITRPIYIGIQMKRKELTKMFMMIWIEKNLGPSWFIQRYISFVMVNRGIKKAMKWYNVKEYYFTDS